MPNLTPFLWFDGKAEEAGAFYTGIFPDSTVVDGNRIKVCGQELFIFDGGPAHAGFNMAISFMVECDTQAEIDRLWDALLAEGEPHRCGWLTDKFGLTWQIVPKGLGDLLRGDDEAGSERAMEAMMAMVKLDLAGLQKAYAGTAST